MFDLCFLDVGTRRRWVVSFMLRQLYSQGRNPRTYRIGSWMGSRTDMDDVEYWIFLPVSGMELWLFCRPASSQSLYRPLSVVIDNNKLKNTKVEHPLKLRRSSKFYKYPSVCVNVIKRNRNADMRHNRIIKIYCILQYGNEAMEITSAVRDCSCISIGCPQQQQSDGYVQSNRQTLDYAWP